MAACFLHVRSREFGQCGEFRVSKELFSLPLLLMFQMHFLGTVLL